MHAVMNGFVTALNLLKVIQLAVSSYAIHKKHVFIPFLKIKNRLRHSFFCSSINKDFIFIIGVTACCFRTSCFVLFCFFGLFFFIWIITGHTHWKGLEFSISPLSQNYLSGRYADFRQFRVVTQTTPRVFKEWTTNIRMIRSLEWSGWVQKCLWIHYVSRRGLEAWIVF